MKNKNWNCKEKVFKTSANDWCKSWNDKWIKMQVQYLL